MISLAKYQESLKYAMSFGEWIEHSYLVVKGENLSLALISEFFRIWPC